MPTSVIPHSIGVGRPTRTVSPFCTDTVTKHQSPTSLWPRGAQPWCSVICRRWRHDRRRGPRHGRGSRPAHDLDVRLTPLVTAYETTHRKGPIVDELLSLGDAPVLPAGGGAARARLHCRYHHEHR